MARKSKSTKGTTDDELSYEEYSGGGARPRGAGGRRNVAPGAQEFEPEDYDEQNRRNVGGEGGGGIQTGTYEDDHGPGARGHRNPEFQTEPSAQNEKGVLRRSSRSGEETEDFPSGAWSKQKTNTRLKQVKSRKVRARGTTGRGVGVPKPKTQRTASAIRHPMGKRRRAGGSGGAKSKRRTRA